MAINVSGIMKTSPTFSVVKENKDSVVDIMILNNGKYLIGSRNGIINEYIFSDEDINKHKFKLWHKIKLGSIFWRKNIDISVYKYNCVSNHIYCGTLYGDIIIIDCVDKSIVADENVSDDYIENIDYRYVKNGKFDLFATSGRRLCLYMSHTIAGNSLIKNNELSDKYTIFKSLVLYNEYNFIGTTNGDILIYNNDFTSKIMTKRCQSEIYHLSVHNNVLYVAVRGGTVECFDLNGMNFIKKGSVYTQYDAPLFNSGVYDITFSPNFQYMFCATTENIQCIDIVNLKSIFIIKPHKYMVMPIVLSKDNKYLLSASSTLFTSVYLPSELRDKLTIVNIINVVEEEADSVHLCGKCSKVANTRCSACKTIYYCSKKCQKKHWKIHKIKCKSLLNSYIYETSNNNDSNDTSNNNNNNIDVYVDEDEDADSNFN